MTHEGSQNLKRESPMETFNDVVQHEQPIISCGLATLNIKEICDRQVDVNNHVKITKIT